MLEEYANLTTDREGPSPVSVGRLLWSRVFEVRMEGKLEQADRKGSVCGGRDTCVCQEEMGGAPHPGSMGEWPDGQMQPDRMNIPVFLPLASAHMPGLFIQAAPYVCFYLRLLPVAHQ